MRTGGEAHTQFVGDVEAERRWFTLAAKMPIISTSANHAANRIYDAVAHGCAEITITPQAWVLARKAGVAPGAMQFAASLGNQFLLPSAPVADQAIAGESLED